jgi:hypothetical protein
MRGDLHFVLTTIGSPFATGALIVAPYYNPNIISTFSYADAYFRPHVILDISDNTSTVDFVVPFRWYRNSCDPFERIVGIQVMVLEPLQGLTSASFTVTAFLENQEFRFLRPTDATALRQTQGLIDVTSISNTLSNIETANLPMEMGGDEFDLKFGMDDVGVGNNPNAYLVRFNTLNNSTNPHSIEKVALHASTVMPSTYDVFNTKVDEMSIKHIFCEREYFYDTPQVSTTTTPTSQIFAMPLAPNPRTVVNQQALSIADFYSSYSKFWRGGMKIKLRFFMNRFQSIKVYAGLFYKTVTPTTFSDWSSSHGVILDIGGDQREVIVEIPYNAETPWLQTLHASTDVTAPSPNYLSIFDHILGQFSLYAITPLVSPSGSPTTIKVHVTYSMCDDFELAGFSTHNRVTQGLMDKTVKLSRDSERTPNMCNDTITSMKDILKKWQLVNVETEVKLSGKWFAFVMSPDSLFELRPVLSNFEAPLLSGTMRGLTGTQRLWGTLPYSGYRGGVKVRFDLDFVTLDQNNKILSMEPDYIPYVYYLNPDALQVANGSFSESEVITSLANCIEGTLKESIIPVTTPFEVLPVNTMRQGDTRIFEFEIPYQRNLKYIPTNLFEREPRNNHFGYMMVVFKLRPNAVEAGEKTTVVDLKYFAKIADDGRFGILETGTATIAGPDTYLWGGSN